MFKVSYHRTLPRCKATLVQPQMKSLHESLDDFVNGDHSLDLSVSDGSYDFPDEGAVDFKKQVTPSRVDLYDFASGKKDIVAPAPASASAPAPAPAPASAPAPVSEPSNE